jgi:hypothetical protein
MRSVLRSPGITFAAQLQFGGIPNTPTSNAFAKTPARALGGTGIAASPFSALPNAETDLCLSLESMRGRKRLRCRGVVDLPEDEKLDESDDAMGVHVCVKLTPKPRQAFAIAHSAFCILQLHLPACASVDILVHESLVSAWTLDVVGKNEVGYRNRTGR